MVLVLWWGGCNEIWCYCFVGCSYGKNSVSSFFLCISMTMDCNYLLDTQLNCLIGVKKAKGQKLRFLHWGQPSYRKLLFGINLIIPMSLRLISFYSASTYCVMFLLFVYNMMSLWFQCCMCYCCLIGFFFYMGWEPLTSFLYGIHFPENACQSFF